MTATFLPKAQAAVSSSRMAFRLRPKLERTRARMIRMISARQTSDSTRKCSGWVSSKPRMRAGGMLVRPPMPPVTDFHSVNTVIASICRPSEAATKYSPRTRNAGSARASEISAASAMPAAVARQEAGAELHGDEGRRVGADAEEQRVRDREDAGVARG